MAKWAAWALLGLCVGLLGWRIFSMEARVQALRGQVAALGTDGARGGEPRAAQAPAARAPGDATVAAALGEQLSALRADLDSLERATHETATRAQLDAAVGDARILSALERRDNEVLDTQLRFHRERWIDARQEAVRVFGQLVELDPDQTVGLKEMLAKEVDVMVELLRQQEVRADPRVAADTWRETLSQTDRAAEELLGNKQLKAWKRLRKQERKALWPWLDE
ncbi:MAG: hypothetical protein OXT09_27920 [Myxococcales bacterium]|nr:hypothetical protein [Myxococcales bacterium]